MNVLVKRKLFSSTQSQIKQRHTIIRIPKDSVQDTNLPRFFILKQSSQEKRREKMERDKNDNDFGPQPLGFIEENRH